MTPWAALDACDLELPGDEGKAFGVFDHLLGEIDVEIGPVEVARRGLLVRHLVLPCGLAGTETVARFLAERISRDTYINVMDQYRPCHEAGQLPPLDRPITRGEWQWALDAVWEAGLSRLDQRRPLTWERLERAGEANRDGS